MGPIRIYILLIFGALFVPSLSNAQQGNQSIPRKIDSLKTILRTAKEDTNKVNTLNFYSSTLNAKTNYPAADSVARKALNLSITLNYTAGISNSYSNIGNVYYQQYLDSLAMLNYMLSYKIDEAADNKSRMATDDDKIGLVNVRHGKYDESLRLYLTALKLMNESNNTEDVYRIYQHIGIIYKKRGNYSEAIKNYLMSLRGAEAANDLRVCGDDHMNLGNAYTEINNDTEALKNYVLGYKNFEAIGSKLGMGDADGNMGNIYEDQGKDSLSLTYYKKALQLGQETGDKQGMTVAYGNMGNVYLKQGNYTEALKMEILSLSLDEELGNKEGIAEDYLNIFGVYLKGKNYSQATDYLNKSFPLIKELGSKMLYSDYFQSKLMLDTSTNNYKVGFFDLSRFMTYRDSMKNEEGSKKILSEQMTYEFDKKQAIEKAEQDKKDAIATAEKRKQGIITISISLGLILVLVFSGLLFSRFRVTQKQKEIIEEQKVLVEEKNKEVLDSITYAKRLQDAILPPLSVIKKAFPESFLLYKPKDIVAGDFYWTGSLPSEEGHEGAFLIAAADCTGHGVPGAMVSVVCSNAMNRAVKEFKITEPGKILDKVRDLVLETFSQRDPFGEKSESDVKDGMDISFASLSPAKEGPATILKWSGAYNPLWIVKAPPGSGRASILEIAPDKQPVGQQDNSRPFTTHELKLQKGDIIYLFTDGYADQFGGPEGKKFKSRQLQQKMLSVASLSMDKQKEMLEETLKDWKGKLDQVDDILIIGIRV